METMKPIHIIILMCAIAIFLVMIFLQTQQFDGINAVETLRLEAYPDDLVLDLDTFASYQGLTFVDNTLYIGTSSPNGLVAYDVTTQEQTLDLNYPARHIVYDDELALLYVVGRGGVINSLTAYNLQNEIVWAINQNNTRIPVRIFVNSAGDDFAWLPSDELARIESDNGVFLSEAIQPNFDLDYSQSASGYFWTVYGSVLEARLIENSNEVIWRSTYEEFPSGTTRQVWFDGNYILMKHSAQLWLINYETGALVWQYDETGIASNFEVIDEEIIVLDAEASLLRLDLLTGAIINRVTFEQPLEDQRRTTVSSEAIGSSVIAVNADYIAIFFGDTDTLAVFSYSIFE
ncbi:MAG: PQQ-binding-like beta-propeller repeat protein [Chloroflexota bacterium]